MRVRTGNISDRAWYKVRRQNHRNKFLCLSCTPHRNFVGSRGRWKIRGFWRNNLRTDTSAGNERVFVTRVTRSIWTWQIYFQLTTLSSWSFSESWLLLLYPQPTTTPCIPLKLNFSLFGRQIGLTCRENGISSFVIRSPTLKSYLSLLPLVSSVVKFSWSFTVSTLIRLDEDP